MEVRTLNKHCHSRCVCDRQPQFQGEISNADIYYLRAFPAGIPSPGHHIFVRRGRLSLDKATVFPGCLTLFVAEMTTTPRSRRNERKTCLKMYDSSERGCQVCLYKCVCECLCDREGRTQTEAEITGTLSV